MGINTVKSPKHPRQRQTGFTLIEVLVTMIIMSIGLLGLAGMQATGLRNNHSAYQRSQASALANEMLDRIRANRTGMNAGNYDAPYDINGNPPDAPTCSQNFSSTSCTATQMADYDVSEWDARIGALLPSGRGDIVVDANSVFEITVMWDDRRNGATGTDCDGDSATNLTCFQMFTRP